MKRNSIQETRTLQGQTCPIAGTLYQFYPDFFLISTEQVLPRPSIHHSSNMRFATSLIEKVRSLE